MRIIKTALSQIRRTPYQAIVAVFSLSLTFLALMVFVSIVGGFYVILNHFENSPQVIAFFKRGEDLSQSQIQQIRNELEATGELFSFKYVSTKEAEKIYKRENADQPALSELVDYRLLPPSIEISAKRIDALPKLRDILQKQENVSDISYYEDLVNNAKKWLVNIRYLGIGMVGFLLITSVLLLVVVIGMKIKNKWVAIETMRLLGGSAWYIHGPFLVEGMIYGFLGALLGWLGTFTLLQYATPFLLNWLKDLISLPLSPQILLTSLLSLLLLGTLVGAFSSLIAVRRFFRA